MRQNLAQFQSDLASEDVRFVERENDLIEKQKQERDEMTRAYQVHALLSDYNSLYKSFCVTIGTTETP